MNKTEEIQKFKKSRTMKDTRLNLANELIERIKNLKKERIKHKTAFDKACKSKPLTTKRKLYVFQIWRMTFSFTLFTVEDLKKVLEARIIEIDSEIEETDRLLNQL